MDNQQESLCPIFVRLEGARVVVVGGGLVGQRKVTNLCNYGASVVVISPEITDPLNQLVRENKIKWLARGYESKDLQGAVLAIAATSNRLVNKAVTDDAHDLGILVNTVDDPSSCNFFVPSVVKRGRLQIAISTGGSSPSIARDIRRNLEEQYPKSWEPYLDLLAQTRLLIKQRIPGESADRRPFYNACREISLLERLECGENITAEQIFREVSEKLTGESNR